jgi:hypothetical protein
MCEKKGDIALRKIPLASEKSQPYQSGKGFDEGLGQKINPIRLWQAA